MTSFYLAGRFNARQYITKHVAHPLQNGGHGVTSSWLSADQGAPVLGKADLKHDLSLGTGHGEECLRDIERADALAVFTEWPSTTGGYHVETGYALGLGKQVHIVGHPLNVFHATSRVTVHVSIDAFLKSLGCVPA